MITCERCQTENLEGSQYCDECGAILPGAHAGEKKITSRNGEVEPGAHGDVAADSPADSPADAVALDDAIAPADAEPLAEPSEARAEKEARAGRKREPAEAHAAAKSQVITPARTSLFKQSGEREEHVPLRRTGSTVAHAKLVIHRGRSVGKEFPLCEDESHIGRWDADGGIFPDVDLDSDDPEAKVSRRHARITRRGEKYYLEDLGSTNGTFVNRGRRLLPGDRQPLRDGDEVIVGKTFLKFHMIKSS
jgi:predicted component of type VI protein secretion system